MQRLVFSHILLKKQIIKYKYNGDYLFIAIVGGSNPAGPHTTLNLTL